VWNADCGFFLRLSPWNVSYDSISALEPAIDLPSRPDVRDEEDFRIDREDNSIVAYSRRPAIHAD